MGKRVRFADHANDDVLDVAALAETPTSAPVSEVAPNPWNPRDSYDDPETRELAETYKTVGQLQTSIVVPRELWVKLFPEDVDQLGDTALWVVVNGNRRWYAAELAGVDLRIEVSTKLTTADAIEDAVGVENIHRAPLPPLKLAEYLQRRVARVGSQRKVAKRLGKSVGWVSQYIALREKLIPELQAALAAGKLEFANTRPLVALPAEQQRGIYQAGPPYKVAVEPEPTPDTDHRSPKSAVEHKPAPADIAPSEAEPVYAVNTPDTDVDHAAGEPVDQTASADSVYAVNTPDTDHRSPTTPADQPGAELLVIRVPAHDTAALARELARHLSAPELAELAELLTRRIGG